MQYAMSKEQVDIAPRMLRLHQYPYINSDKWGVEDTGSSMTGQNGNPYNCFCFYEFDFDQASSLPEDAMPFNGNFAWPEDGSKDGSLGTFAIKSSVFPTSNPTLHYNVQYICEEVIAYPLVPLVIDRRSDGNTVYLSQRFAKIDDMTNDERNDLQNFQSEEGYYDLGKPSDVQYCWSKSVSAPGNEIFSSDGAWKANYNLTAETSVHLDIGLPDSPIFTLSGHVRYFGSITWPTEDADNVAQWYPDFNHELNWTATLNVDNLIRMTPLQKSANVTSVKRTMNIYPESSWDYILRGYRKMVGGVLWEVADALIPPYVEVTCPGKDELGFGTAAVNAVGDIIVPIHYLEPDASRVTWISTPEDRPQNTNTATNVVYTSDTSVTKDTPHITWTGSVTYDADTKKNESHTPRIEQIRCKTSH
ncbi:hypothetical protein EAE96_004815 [Botrytis aclada]|nr:hypothetical protein EAE96_004815 [Botrytis aclada]